jgi:hypothetical protein
MFAAWGCCRVSLLRAIAFTACAWGLAFLCTWFATLALGSGAIR